MKPVVKRNGKGSWKQIYLQPLGAGLEGKHETLEKILEKGGNNKGCPCQLSFRQ
jgi:hypothetical protein